MHTRAHSGRRLCRCRPRNHWSHAATFPHLAGRARHGGATRRPLDGLRRQLRANDLWFIALAALVGLIAAGLMVLQAGIAHGLQSWLYALAPEQRLSTATSMTATRLLVLPLGGLLVGLVTLMARRRKRPSWMRWKPMPCMAGACRCATT